MTARERAEELERQLWDTRTQTEDIAIIEQAITAAIEEDRKTRECCKAEREACAEIANAEAWEYATHSQGEECAQIIAYKIRARSEGDNNRRESEEMNTPKETIAVILLQLKSLEDHEVGALNLAVQRGSDPSKKPGYEKVKDLFQNCTPEELKDAFACEVDRRPWDGEKGN